MNNFLFTNTSYSHFCIVSSCLAVVKLWYILLVALVTAISWFPKNHNELFHFIYKQQGYVYVAYQAFYCLIIRPIFSNLYGAIPKKIFLSLSLCSLFFFSFFSPTLAISFSLSFDLFCIKCILFNDFCLFNELLSIYFFVKKLHLFSWCLRSVVAFSLKAKKKKRKKVFRNKLILLWLSSTY